MTESYEESSKSPTPEIEEEDTIRFAFQTSFSHKPPMLSKHLKTREFGSMTLKDMSQRQIFFHLGASQASINPLLDSISIKRTSSLGKLEEENDELPQNLKGIVNNKDEEDEEEDLFEKYNIKIEIEPKYCLIRKYNFLGFEVELRRLNE